MRLISENANVLMDRTPAEARVAAERAIAALGADIELSRLRLRESAGRYFADVVVTVPPGRAVVEGHQSANLIEEAVERALPGSDVVVHVEPRRRGLDLRDRILAIALAEPLVMEAHDITIIEHDDVANVSLHLKFPADLDLEQAAQIAERVERAICERPDVATCRRTWSRSSARSPRARGRRQRRHARRARDRAARARAQRRRASSAPAALDRRRARRVPDARVGPTSR